MKKLILTLLTLATLSTGRAQAAPSPISQDQLASYLKAVILVINSESFDCKSGTGEVTGTVADIISVAKSGTIDTDGDQPLLTFTTVTGYERILVTVTSTSDLKAIQSLKVERYAKVEVNNGDLKSPVINWVDQLIGKAQCNKNP